MLLRSLESQMEGECKCQEPKEAEQLDQPDNLRIDLDVGTSDHPPAEVLDDHQLQSNGLEAQPNLLSPLEGDKVEAAPPEPHDDRHLQDHSVEDQTAVIASDPESEIAVEIYNDLPASDSATGWSAADSETATTIPPNPVTSTLTNGATVVDPIQLWSGDQNAEEQDLVPDEIDSDSALGSDTQSETTSLAESIWHFRMEHGRTYHAYKDGKYIFPNDEREADRLDMQHHLLRITYHNKLFFSPLNNPRRCVDIGTGTGIWAIDFADEFPGCEVLGVDLSPNQPSFVPPNLKFVVDDAEDLWLYEQKFDFIHLRLMAGCFADWPKFFRQAYENLEPGGWLEIQDYGLPVRSKDNTHVDTDVYRWGELLCEAGRNMGRPLGNDCSDNHPRWMRDAGFVDIKEEMFMWPINGWPRNPFMKELGRWNQVNIIEGLEGFCLALLTRGLGWKKQEVDIFVAKVTNDLKDKKIHAYFPMPVTYGRKPLPGEVPFT